MADNPSQNSRIRNNRTDPSYDVYDEDPLVELARIVSEEGGYLNIADQNQAMPDPSMDIGYDEIEADLGVDLENQLMEELELSMAPEDDYEAGFQDENYVPVDAGYTDQHSYAAGDAAALAQLSAGADDGALAVEPPATDADWQVDAHSVGEAPGNTAVYTDPMDESMEVLSAQDLSDLETALSGSEGYYQTAPFDEFAEQVVDDDAAGPEQDDLIDADPAMIDDVYQIPPVVAVGGEFADTPENPDKRSGRKMVAIAAVLSIAVLGGGVLAMMNSTSQKQIAAAPPVFKADDDPIKVAPEAGEDVASRDGQTVFDVAANEAEPVREELVERAEKPVDRVIPLEQTEQTDVLRPVGAGDEKDTARLSADRLTTASAPKREPIGPRQVTTVKVSADGTIIRPSLDENSSPSQAGSETTIIGGLPTPISEPATDAASASEPEPVPVRVVEINTTQDDNSVSAGGDAASPLDDIVAGLPATESTGDTNAGTVETVAVRLPRARPDEAQKPAVVKAATDSSGLVAQPARTLPASQGAAPVNLLDTANKTSTGQQPAPVSTGSTGNSTGYLVQLSSQRSQDQALAAFNGLKRRYPALLGEYEANIQRADLGSRGIYYRVRVGPMADKALAAQFCQQLKSSGGSCFVTR